MHLRNDMRQKDTQKKSLEVSSKVKNHIYPAGDRDTELDLAQEFAALAARNGTVSPSQ